jgi:hypothetical protein
MIDTFTAQHALLNGVPNGAICVAYACSLHGCHREQPKLVRCQVAVVEQSIGVIVTQDVGQDVFARQDHAEVVCSNVPLTVITSMVETSSRAGG